MTSHKSTTSRMRDYCDSKGFSEHPVFSVDPNALQVQLYYDDVDVCNPIGSKSIIHKLGKCMGIFWLFSISLLLYIHAGLFYYTLTNIAPALRSTLRAIMLLAVVKTSHIDEYGIDVILKPFVEEMRQLESVRCVKRDLYSCYRCCYFRRKVSLSVSMAQHTTSEGH